MATTETTLPERLAAARAENARLQDLSDRIEAAFRAARDEASLQYYRHAATELAREYREHRDALKTKLDELATADKLDLNQLFAAFVKLSDADSRAGGLAVHASMLQTLEPEPRNHIGVQPMPRGAQVAELYKGMSFGVFLDQLIGRRRDAIRAQHRAELETLAHKEISAAEQSARAAAADGSG
jgi:hypothetical protein